jgi:hypothetical protein
MTTHPLAPCAARPSPHLGPILTEEHWLTSGDPTEMANFLGERGSPRRWQLFACHCCWRILPLLDDRGRDAVRLAEQLAEGRPTTRGEVREALAEVLMAVLEATRMGFNLRDVHAAMAAEAALSAPRRAFFHVRNAVGAAHGAETATQCDLFRELFGNPFRPFVFDPAWRTPLVLTIASQAYQREEFADLPVLADALEDAGCDDRNLLAHLRAATPHHRGCWALDAVLDKP